MMKRSRKQITAITLALGMAATGALAAYGATVSDTTVAIQANNGTESTTITGTIGVSTLKVTMPLTVGFDIDPSLYNKDDAAWYSIQVTNPSNYTITNESASAVYVYISGVSEITQGVTLTNAKADIEDKTKNKTVALAIKKAGTTADYATVGTDFWLTSATSKYYMDANKGWLAAGNVTDGTNKMTLNIYGLTQYGWDPDETFSFKPTFTASLKDPAI